MKIYYLKYYIASLDIDVIMFFILFVNTCLRKITFVPEN